MKRRQILGAAGAGLAASLWPSWLREAFGEGPSCEGQGGTALARIAALAAAFRSAREAGKPLLVLVIPAGDMDKWERGRAFGELLNHGTDVQLAPLSRAEVVCASMADLKKLVPTAGAGEPRMVLVSTDRVPSTARQLDVELPDYSNRWGEVGETAEEHGRKEGVIADKRIALMAGLVRGALGADDKRAAALAAEVKKQIIKKPPRGAKWAVSHGCGTEIEGDTEQMMVACGMGQVPEKSARFLYFFTKRVF